MTPHQPGYFFHTPQDSGGKSKSGMVPLHTVTNKHLSAFGELKIVFPHERGKTFGLHLFSFVTVFSLLWRQN